MTVCAGVCSYQGYGGLCSIRLSVPLLKLRPRKDFVETLLHEMIHAYLFVTDGNDDHDGHGPAFHDHMYRINKAAGTNISVYHTFHDEVALYRTHWWKCNGPCQHRKPFYGMVKRSMNRAPGKHDRWYDRYYIFKKVIIGVSVYFVYLQLFDKIKNIIMSEIGSAVLLFENQQFCKFAGFI